MTRRSLQRSTTALAALAIAVGTLPAHAQIKPTHPNGEVSLVIDFDVKPGFTDEFERLFTRSVGCGRLDPGNIFFAIHKVIGAEGRYVAYSIWRSPEALQSHLERPYSKELFAMFERALARPMQEGRRFISDLSPAPRTPPGQGDPANDPNCR